jgi:hypothetical protein
VQGRKPYDLDMQRAVLSLGLDLLVDATAPGTTVVTPYEWSADHAWKDNLNAFNQQRVRGLTEAARTFHDDLETHYVVLAGAADALWPPATPDARECGAFIADVYCRPWSS